MRHIDFLRTVESHNLSAVEYRIVCLFASNALNSDDYPSAKEISDHIGIKRNTFFKALKNVRNLPFMRVVARPGYTNVYEVKFDTAA